MIHETVIFINVSQLATIRGINPPLRLNYEYIVGGIRICKCGICTLDVGVIGDPKIDNVCDCGNRSNDGEIHWCGEERFIKKKTMEDSIEEQYNEILSPREQRLANASQHHKLISS